MKLSIVVPCFNEEKNIPLLIERFQQVIKRPDIEVIFVDNGSTDGSAGLFAALIPKYPFAKLVSVEVNQGYGYGILRGLAACKGEYLGWTHADLQTDPQDTIKALGIIEKSGSEVFVKGNRKRRPWADRIFTFGMSIFETVYLREGMNDINAQPNIFPRTFYEAWRDPPHDFSLDLYAYYLARKNGLQVKRFDVLFPERVHGKSKWNVDWKSKYKFIKRTLQFSRELDRRLKQRPE